MIFNNLFKISDLNLPLGCATHNKDGEREKL